MNAMVKLLLVRRHHGLRLPPFLFGIEANNLSGERGFPGVQAGQPSDMITHRSSRELGSIPAIPNNFDVIPCFQRMG